jgi:hypothetical protein
MRSLEEDFFKALRARPVDCLSALKYQGMRDHSLQDFFAHAVRKPDGGWYVMNFGTDGSPHDTSQMMPGRTDKHEDVFKEEAKEAIGMESDEMKVRVRRAKAYTRAEYQGKLLAWWRDCGCFCNEITRNVK